MAFSETIFIRVEKACPAASVNEMSRLSALSREDPTPETYGSKQTVRRISWSLNFHAGLRTQKYPGHDSLVTIKENFHANHSHTAVNSCRAIVESVRSAMDGLSWKVLGMGGLGMERPFRPILRLWIKKAGHAPGARSCRA